MITNCQISYKSFHWSVHLDIIWVFLIYIKKKNCKRHYLYFLKSVKTKFVVEIMPVVDRSSDGLCFGYRYKNKFENKTNFNIELLYSVETSNLDTGPGYIANVTRASDKMTG